MNIGDLVTDSREHMKKDSLFYDAWLRYGLVIERYDTAKGLVTVAWWKNGKYIGVNPFLVSKLEVISEARA